jgi:formylglycine-generating enzyme required for sulfatase activity
MSKAREDRYPTADALVVALETCLSLDAPRRRALPLRSIAVAAGLLALVGIVAVSRGASTSGAPPSAVDTTPPTLRLSVPRDGLEVWAETVSVEGRVSPDDPKTVHVTVKGHPEVSVSWSGRTFRAMVSLRADERGVDVVVTDAAGNTASASRTLRRPPRWLLEVAPGQRPPIPLPLGMSFGAAPGEYVNDRDGSVLVWIAPAAFPMGSKRARRMVRLTRGYFLGKYEVSWAQFRRYCAARKARVPNNRSAMPTGEVEAGENHPVFRVTWDEAVAYCNWAGLRLPTEAEWELGAAGTEGRRYPWGSSEPNGSRLNLADASTRGIFVGTEPWSDGHPVTAPVDAYPDGVSPYGCFNMVGNVSEWVADRWSEHPSLTELTDPLGPDSGHAHVVKSGSFKVGRAWCYSAFRATWTTSETIGFRVCRWP